MLMTKKPRLVTRALAPLLVVFQAMASYTMAFAQAPDVKVDINTNSAVGGAFYETWWFWVLVGLFVLIIIIALTQRGRTVVKS